MGARTGSPRAGEPYNAGVDASLPTRRLALTVGDPAGIGPEITHAALREHELVSACSLVVLGPESLRPHDVPLIAAPEAAPERGAAWIASEASGSWEPGRVQESAGHAALAALGLGAQLALEGRVDALVTGPVSKEALHLAGEEVEGQTELLARWAGVSRYEMIVEAGGLRVMLLTRHMPLRRALELVEPERIVARLTLFDEALRAQGLARPRLAVAGLNPHAGEAGLLGSEDLERIAPAVARACALGLDVTGPVSPDTVFLAARGGSYDGVLALYHDQAFIPLKLLSEGRGVTWIAGLPYLRVSPVHGTAFDIAGRNQASPANLIAALRFALERPSWQTAGPAG